MKDEAVRAPAYASGMRGGDKPASGKLRRVEIEIAKNGFVVACHYDRKDKKGEPLWDAPEQKVFVNLKDVTEFLEAELSGKAESGEEG